MGDPSTHGSGSPSLCYPADDAGSNPEAGRSGGHRIGVLSHFFPPDIGGISRLHSYTVEMYPEFGTRPVVVAGGRTHTETSDRYPILRSPRYSRAFEIRRDIRRGRYGEDDPYGRSGWAGLINELSETIAPFFARHHVALVNSHVFSDLCVGQEVAKTLGVPHVHIGHSSYRSRSYLRAESERLGSQAPFVSQEYVRKTLRTSTADLFVVHSLHVRGKYVEIGVSPDRIQVIPPAVDLSTFRPDPAGAALLRRRLGLGGRILITCPTLRKGGFETLLAAFTAFVRQYGRDAYLLCCDSHDIADEYQRMVKDAGLAEQVAFTSFAPQSMPAVYTASDLVVMCSVEEGIGLPALEARACGTPVVANRFGPFLEFVDHEVDGLLVDRGDAEALAGSMSRVVGDSVLRRRLGLAGTQRARSYSHALLAGRYLDVFHGVLA